MSALEIIGYPVSVLLGGVHSLGLSWPAAVIIVSVLVRVALIPASYLRRKGTHTLTVISQRRSIELHKLHHDDPAAYRRVFSGLYASNKVSPASAFGWFALQIGTFIMVSAGLRMFVDEFASVRWFGSSFGATAGASDVGLVLVVIEVALVLGLLWQARTWYAQATWYVRLGSLAVAIVLPAIIGLILWTPLLIYVITIMMFVYTDWPILTRWARYRHGKQGWPIYDENGSVLTYSFENKHERESAII